MVSVQDLKTVAILDAIGAKPEYTDVDLSIPAGSTVTITYTVLAGYTWIKQDVRLGPMTNRVFEVDIYVDESVEMQGVDLSIAFAMETWECITASVAHNRWWARVKNTDSVAHNLDMLIRGALVRDGAVPILLDELRKVSLTDDAIDKLADKIAEKMRKE